jgi:hypothetical protein
MYIIPAFDAGETHVMAGYGLEGDVGRRDEPGRPGNSIGASVYESVPLSGQLNQLDAVQGGRLLFPQTYPVLTCYYSAQVVSSCEATHGNRT